MDLQALNLGASMRSLGISLLATVGLSFMIDYRPVQRVDLYAGVALSNVYRGLANGFLQTQNIDPTVGLRIKF
jgi:hypothetical protein